jgi:RIO kinase 1
MYILDLQVFHQAYIPRCLEEVADHEGDFERLAAGGETEGIYYQGITGMRADMSGARLVPAILERAQMHNNTDPDDTSPGCVV